MSGQRGRSCSGSPDFMNAYLIWKESEWVLSACFYIFAYSQNDRRVGISPKQQDNWRTGVPPITLPVLNTCVCMHMHRDAHTQRCTHTHRCTHIHMHTHAYAHRCTRIHRDVHTHRCTHTYTRTHTCTCTQMHTHRCTCIHRDVHTHRRTCTHTLEGRQCLQG